MPKKRAIASHRNNREAAELYVAMICGLLLVVYKLSLHYAQAIQNYFMQVTTLPIANLIADSLFFVVVVLLAITHARWKRSLFREREIERVLASIRQEVIMTVGRDRRITMCNEAVQSMYGYTPQEVIGETTELLYYDRRSADPRDSVFHSLQVVGFHVGEATGRRKNGAEFILEIVTGDLTGAPGAVVLLRDVTELKTMAARITENETRYRRMFELSPEAIITITPDGTISAVNERVTDWLGYTPPEIEGRPLQQMPFWSKKCLAIVGEKFQQRMRGEEVPAYDLEFVAKDGTQRIGNINATPVMGENGLPIEELVVISDVTTQRRAEEAIRRARDAAIESADLKSQFLANMSHEIRTPMNGIITVAQLALGTDMTPEQRECLETIADSSQNLLRIINDILDFSKLEAGKLEFHNEPFNLRDSVADALRPHALDAATKDVEVVASVEPLLPDVVVGDAARLNQILTNLVGNAVKFTETGDVVTAVTLESETRDAITIRFDVNDTGIGIPKHRLDSIFEAFNQADASTSRQYGGTGLGLSICTHLVEILGGTIGADSTEGEGSTFWFTARFAKARGTESAKQIPSAALSCRVLVAAGSDALRDSITKLLDTWRCPYAEVPDARSAWQKLRDAAGGDSAFEVLLADAAVTETDLDGEGPLATLVEHQAFKTIKTIEVVPLAEFEGGTRRSGATARVATPVRPSDLYNTLLFVLGRQSLHTHPAPPAEFNPEKIAAPTGREWRLLLAEDNLTNQKVALTILKKAGLTADVASNGEEAIAALSERDYDLVLMDVQMPVMDGLEAMRRIRAKASPVRKPDIPAIAMTAHAMKGDRARCLDAGMNDYISKPIDPSALVESIRQLLSDAPATLTEPTTDAPPAADTQKTDTPVFDRDGAMRRMGNDEEFFSEVLTIYKEDVDKQLTGLTSAIAGEDTETARLHAHTVKGASANVGAMRAQRLAEQLEFAARDGTLEANNAPALLADLQAAVHEFIAATA